jgi:multidrug efflux pump subunit AcrB
MVDDDPEIEDLVGFSTDLSGIVGRLFREFGVTVTVAVVLSALIALTLSPMMASLVLKNPKKIKHNCIYDASERGFEAIVRGYERILKLSLSHQPFVMLLNNTAARSQPMCPVRCRSLGRRGILDALF